MKHLFWIILLSFVALPPMEAALPGKKTKLQLPANLPKKFTDQEIGWIKTKLSEEFYTERVKLISTEFLSGRNRVAIQPPVAKVYTEELKKYSRYYFFESDTGLDSRFAVTCVKYAEALHKAKVSMQDLVMNQKTNTEEYRKWYAYYNKTVKDFAALAARPSKSVNRKRINYLEKVKQVVRQQIEETEQAKQDRAPKLDGRKLSGKK